MNYVLSSIILATIFSRGHATFNISFQDLLPIKYDITRIRNESQILENTGQSIVLDFIGLVELHKGYTAEEHEVTTRDGYHLTFHRITGSPSSPRAFGKPVVFLLHGVLMSSDGFVVRGPGKDLAFLLADAGYDVWLGNARGNTYSRSHSKLKPSSKKFWDFSWHEVGTIDLPTFIDYILKATGEEKLVYVGFSMGTTASYVLLSNLPEYNDKISLVIGLAPVAFWKGNLPRILRFVADNFEAVQNFTNRNEYFEILPQSTFLPKLAKTFCSNPRQPFARNPCSQVLEQFLPILDLTRCNFSYPKFLKYTPAGSSAKTLLHYVQNAMAGEFQEYDYGVTENLKKYSKERPPVYNLTRVTAPVALIYGPNDYFGPSRENVRMLMSKLPNVIESVKVSHRKFNHGDFMVASDAKELIYDSVLSIIKNYNYYLYSRA